jgi:general secretion pathway protein E
MFNRPRLGEILIELRAATLPQIESALEQQQEKGGRLGDLLVERRVCGEVEIVRALSRQLGYEAQQQVNVDEIDLSLLSELSLRWSRDQAVLPLRRRGEHVLVATSDPLGIRVEDHLRFVLQREPVPVLVPRSVLLEAINLVFDRKLRQTGGLTEGLDEAQTRTEDSDVPEIEDILVDQESNDEAPVIQFVNSVFVRAVRERASDIHIEPSEGSLHVRFRIDGVLKEVAEPPKRFQSSILARIKIMAALNIAEKRLPQDGRIRIKIAGKDIDIRVATAPTAHGERITMRLLDKSAVKLDLGVIGFSTPNLTQMRKLIRVPHGILLVTGPTGSGKTTTLYSALTEINTPDKNILTVEDPVEYQIKGISQMQVNPKIDLTFASGLRSYLRHDPDIIMVGEIRDKETAEIAIQASLTGHFVLSTLHTNDAAGSFTRLIDMGVEPFLVASSMIAVLAQRLVRKLCLHCREAYVPIREDMDEIGISHEMLEGVGGKIFRARGCARCSSLGYMGRAGIFELLSVTDEVKALVIRSADAGTIKRAAVKVGMKTLREDGARKVLLGETSIEEVMRVTQDEQIEQV